ncbi:MAG TPA: phosphatase PAP2 family protein [Marinagarivorans sp.]|nr:phosphatase PAP2 family protein [Cellvibrionaceae bacterium]HMY39676.1 phosphatase PAP2 family protein [Marinagarivorans sp.]HNG59397.1 phosphatase PAP2 family protein [Cellvibrionaceae bacterium]
MSLRNWDIGLFYWLNNLGRHMPLAAELITHLADHGWTAPLLVILLAKQPRWLAAALVAALFIHLGVREFKHYFEVLRPCFDPQLAAYVFSAGPDLNIDSYSFPSGHSATASLISVALVALWGRRAQWPALIFALLVAASRSMLGAHFPSDTSAGLALGMIISVAAFYAGARLQLSPQGERLLALLVWLLAAGLLVFILLAGQHNYPLWFKAASKLGCLLGLGVVGWQVKTHIGPRNSQT